MQESMIKQAIAQLKSGELVITPTESVYGVVADPMNPAAIDKLFAAKQRKKGHALTVHIADPAEVYDWVREVPTAAQALIDKHWPGPLTLVLPKADQVSRQITGGKESIGIRCPDHPIAQALIRGMGHGLIMSSANISGQPSPVTADEAREQLGHCVSIILDDGPCQHGIASTVIDATVTPMRVLREGSILMPKG